MSAPSRPPSKDQPQAPPGVGRLLRRYFLAGLAALFPIAVTLWLLVQIFQFADSLLGQYFGFQIPGLGLLVTILLILVVGVLSVHVFGRLVFGTLEAWLTRLPLVRKIYPTVKQLSEFLFGEGGPGTKFRRTVLVQFPRGGMYALAFVTNETTAKVNGKPQRFLILLVSNPPSPFSGPIVMVPEDEVIPLELSVEDALKFVVSGGVVGAPLASATAQIAMEGRSR